MQALKIEATDETPGVMLDPAAGTFEFSGKSLPENVTAFYGPVMVWLDEYGKRPAASTVVDFKLLYFNTASSKIILDILFKLETFVESGADIKVRWYFQEEDEDMKEAGEEYGDLVEMPFVLQAF